MRENVDVCTGSSDCGTRRQARQGKCGTQRAVTVSVRVLEGILRLRRGNVEEAERPRRARGFRCKRILLEKPEVGVYADGMMIVVGEQGEIDVNGRSLGPVRTEHAHLKNELIAEIISH